MHQAPGEAVQKLCPRCSALAYTGDRHCPWCGSSYRRRLWPGLVAVVLAQSLILLGGLAYLGIRAADELDTRLDREVNRVERELDRNFRGVEQSVREELDRRLPTP
jgi:RNA polymerase subunit RPABC4/transcription elongation factor Spt4